MNMDITEIMYRLKTRLALANFKRQHGYEKMDLHTLETNLVINKPPKKQRRQRNHRSYPYNIQYPLSEKRSTFPKITTEEDAANVLVMLHNSHKSLCT